jgi:hypothetical protein
MFIRNLRINNMQQTEKLGTITRVGPKRTEFANGSKITIGGKDGKPSFPGVSVGVQFDFEPNVWYSGILFEKQAESLAEGKQVNVNVWEKESNGKMYKNFSIISPKKAEAAELEKKINELTTTQHRMVLQLTAVIQDVTKLKDWVVKKDTTTAFDPDFKQVHPDKYAALHGDSLSNAMMEYNSIDEFAQANGLETVDTALDINIDDISY